MSNALIVHKGRTNLVAVQMGTDVSADELTSEIRAEPEQTALLIATWTVTKPNGGADGEVLLTLDDLTTGQIAATSGYMDIKRLVGTEPYPVFEKPLEVVFQGTVTQ
jgi:hypothetical protein